MENKTLTEKKVFIYEYYPTMEEIRKLIQEDEGCCIQQVCYSTFHDCLTQINFTKRIIRSNLR